MAEHDRPDHSAPCRELSTPRREFLVQVSAAAAISGLGVSGAPGQGGIGGVGLGQGVGRVVTDEGVEVFVHPPDLLQARLGGRARRRLAGGEFRGQFGNRQLIQHDHSPSRLGRLELWRK